jgi:hypothetical protein
MTWWTCWVIPNPDERFRISEITGQAGMPNNNKSVECLYSQNV